METTWLALLIKPLALVAFVAAYYFLIIVPVRWLRRKYPNSKWANFLLRDR
jgi:hypothetical protein